MAGVASEDGIDGAPRLIKRYGNRRLYDTVEHRYISRDELAGLARARVIFEVRDARTGADLTRVTLLALLTEGEGAASGAISVELLRELASAQHEVVREFFGSYLAGAFRAYVQFGQAVLGTFSWPAGPPPEAGRRGEEPRAVRARGRRRKS